MTFGGRYLRQALLLALSGLLAACATGTPAAPPDTPLVGTKMKGAPAPEFRLLDEDGAEVPLASLRGKVVLLDFQYSYCPDTLPDEMRKFLEAHAGLGGDVKDVALFLVSVDPERDSVGRVHEYLAGQAALGKVKFLTGDRATLEPLWKAYYLYVERFPVKTGSPESRRYGAYSVAHTEVIYLVDKQGRLRLLMRPDFVTADLVANVRALLRE